MIRSLSVAAMLAAGCVAPAVAQVYRCPDSPGKTVMQQTPCAGGEKVTIRPGSGMADPQSAAKASGDVARMNQRSAIAQGIATGKPVIGMTVAEVQQALGAPTRLNQGNYGGRQSDQAIFERNGITWYVYTENGVVTSIQNAQGYGNSAPAKPPCPTSHELRDAAISADSMTASESAVRRHRSLLEQQRACR